MRMSCNGCRVLRKGCSESCSIRPCLEWIKSPESQANATVFLAKFYGRAGLINLIHAGPEHLRPDIFRSLLYEACGRIANPIYGSVGLLWSGSWQQCQATVDAVLSGSPLAPIPSSEEAGSVPVAKPLPPKAYDIRHVPKADADLRRVNRSRNRFKRPCARTKSAAAESAAVAEDESAFSPEAETDSHLSQGEAISAEEYGFEVALELTLGSFERDSQTGLDCPPAAGHSQCDARDLKAQAGKLDRCLQLRLA